MKKQISLKMALYIGIIFFVLGLITLPHYGINWDTINHAPRGQAYLKYFLTGERDYANLPDYVPYWQNEKTIFFDPDLPKESIPRVSLYQTTGLDFTFFVDNDGNGHPPLSDILAASFNLILFQKLGIINDIDSYRVYGVLLAAILVGVVFWWVGKKYGLLAGLVSAAVLASYPLFWAESHFNIEKDVPETVYWSLMLFSIWYGVTKRRVLALTAAAILFGLALGTKFNILFIPLVIAPWFLFFLYKNNPIKFISKNKLILLNLGIIPVIGFLILILTWPYLWADPIGNLQSVIKFYKDLGTTTGFDPRFLGPFGINTYPIRWIVFTTPVFVLILSFAGLFFSIKRLTKEKDGFLFLILLWFLVPILRVTWPGSNIYGGIRQIMEYIPALAILAGLGAKFLQDTVKRKHLVNGFIVLGLATHLLRLISIHPNENVYFNVLAGGLSGARQMDIPSWGNTFGAAYRQGVSWINTHTEPNAKLTYARELIPNIPRVFLRRDIVLHNSNRSGYLRKGEYTIALTYDDTEKTSYFDRYLQKFLKPVSSVEVDGVAVLQIWHNTVENSYPQYLTDNKVENVKLEKLESGIRMDFQKHVELSRIEIEFDENNCKPLEYGYVQISLDGIQWTRLPGVMPGEDWSVPSFGKFPDQGKIMIPFAADRARYVDMIVSPLDACALNIKKIQSFIFNP